MSFVLYLKESEEEQEEEFYNGEEHSYEYEVRGFRKLKM